MLLNVLFSSIFDFLQNENFLTQKTGQYKGYPFRSWSYSGFTDGFSDHFPVYVYLVKEVN